MQLLYAAILAVIFTVFTICAATVDVKPIGFEGEEIGFAAMNGTVYESVSSNAYFDKMSDLFLGAALITAAAFAVAGLVQLIKRKKFLKVDHAILLLGAVYILVILFYLLFELISLNGRPGSAEASYPSSHLLVVMTVATTALLFAFARIRDKKTAVAVCVLCIAVAAFTGLCRLYSGEHWVSDIIGAVILSNALSSLYGGMLALFDEKKAEKTENEK